MSKRDTKFIDDGFVYLTDTKAAEFPNCVAIADDLVFTAAGSIGQVGIIPKESLAIFDLLKKPELTAAEVKKIKDVAVTLLATLKAEKLKVDQWRDKEATRDAVRLAIKDFLWNDETGLPVDYYDEDEVRNRAEEVYRHIYRVYPEIPSPYFEREVVA